MKTTSLFALVILSMEIWATDYVWTGEGVDSNWATPGNWEPVGIPDRNDTAIFDSLAEVSISSATTVSNAVLNGDVALSSANASRLALHGSWGVGKWILEGTAGFQNNGSGAVVSNDVHLAGADASVTNKFYSYDYSWTFQGRLTGKATLMASVNTMNVGLVASGDWSDFEGHVYVVKYPEESYRENIRNRFTISGENRGSEKASWDIYTSNDNPFAPAYQTVKFGSLSGEPYIKQSDSRHDIFEIGAKGLDDTLAGQWHGSTMNSTHLPSIIRKVGSGELSFSGKNIGGYELAGGILNIKSNNSNPGYYGIVFTNDVSKGWTGGTLRMSQGLSWDPSACISNSTAAIKFDSNGNDYTWKTGLTASNKGGLVKMGTGKLTLEAKPKYAGVTQVVGGSLVVNAGSEWEHVAGAGTVCATNGTAWSYTFTPAESGNASVEAAAGKTPVEIPLNWIAANTTVAVAVNDLLAKRTTGNKIPYAACYALGLDPDDEESVPKLAETSIGVDGKIDVSLVCGTVPDGVTVSVTAKSYSAPDGEEDAAPVGVEGDGITIVGGASTTGRLAIDPTVVTSSVKYWKLAISFSGTDAE